MFNYISYSPVSSIYFIMNTFPDCKNFKIISYAIPNHLIECHLSYLSKIENNKLVSTKVVKYINVDISMK